MRVLYVQYTNPGMYPPLVRGAKLLAESGAQVAMVGTRVRGTDALSVAPERGIDVRLMPAATDGWKLKAHYARYAAWVTRQGTSWRPDWIYASDVLSTPIAIGLAALTGARVVYHEHDAPSPSEGSWAVRWCLDARRRLVRQADIVVTPNAERSAQLSARAGDRSVYTVWNCPRRPTERPSVTKATDCLRVIFRGSLNALRLPLAAIDALAQVGPRVTLDIAGYETVGSRGFLSSVSEHAERLGVGERVRVLGTVPEEQLSIICEQCNLGLAFMPQHSHDENMRHMTGASNKVFEYLGYGVTPVVSDLPDWRRTFVDPGCAIACDPTSAESIATTFAWAIQNPDAVTAVAERGWQRLSADWNYETQFEPVLKAMWDGSTEIARPPAIEHPAEAECAS